MMMIMMAMFILFLWFLLFLLLLLPLKEKNKMVNQKLDRSKLNYEEKLMSQHILRRLIESVC
jgi:hypothetical protein